MARENTEVKQNNAMYIKSTKKNKVRKVLDNKILYGLMAFVIGVGIIALVLGGSFYFVVKNNVNGVGEKYRNNIKNIPFVNKALPAVIDPDDPKNMTNNQLVEKYNQLRIENAELKNKLNELSLANAELLVYKADDVKNKEENEVAKKEIEQLNAALEEKKKKYDVDKKLLDTLIASGDKTGFKDFFEKVDKENAQRIYSSIIQEQKVSEEAKKFAQLYESMDATAAAKIFEQMGTAKIDLVVDILKNMNKQSTAEIMASMTPTFASNVTEKLSKLYLGK